MIVAREELKAFIERVERMEAERKKPDLFQEQDAA